MGYRIGKEYTKMKCPLCSSIYLLDKQDINIYQKEIEMSPEEYADMMAPPDIDDDEFDDMVENFKKSNKPLTHKIYRFSFWCEECYQYINGIPMGYMMASDDMIEDMVSQMRPLYSKKDSNRKSGGKK